MRKRVATILVLACCLWGNKTVSQSFQTILDVNNFLSDALWYADTFITPATDAAVYQASSTWVTTPQKKKLWDVGINVHFNAFFVPNGNRDFNIKNSDFSFFEIQGGDNVNVPTALGDDKQVYLVGYINDGQTDNEVRLKTPEGIDMGSVIYPYLQASLGLWYGTEIIGKYSYKVELKRGYYQVYGAGIKHNLSQYFPKLEAQNYAAAAFAGYSNEEISFGFLSADTEQYQGLGLNEITGLVDTYQFQLNGSKRWGRFEAMAGLITNVSDIRYEVGGQDGTPFFVVPVKDYVNDRLSEIYKTRTNLIGEFSGRYGFGDFYLQGSVAFGKFVNTNLSVQYEL